MPWRWELILRIDCCSSLATPIWHLCNWPGIILQTSTELVTPLMSLSVKCGDIMRYDHILLDLVCSSKKCCLDNKEETPVNGSALQTWATAEWQQDTTVTENIQPEKWPGSSFNGQHKQSKMISCLLSGARGNVGISYSSGLNEHCFYLTHFPSELNLCASWVAVRSETRRTVRTNRKWRQQI